jgi:5'-3' exonuclease
MPRIFLIDGNSQMYRAYHAIRGLTGPDGKSTNAIYGFVNMLRKLIADHHPDYIVASFDLPGRTFRDDLAADYKAGQHGAAFVQCSRRDDVTGQHVARTAGIDFGKIPGEDFTFSAFMVSLFWCRGAIS